MAGPDAFGPFRGFLEDDEILGGAASSVAHAYSRFVPSDEIYDFECGVLCPVVDAGAEVEFVDPEEEVSAGT